MKKTICLLLAVFLVLSLCACGNEKPTDNSSVVSGPEETTEQEETPTPEPTPSEEDLIDDPAWDELFSLGKVETENGLLFVRLTVPADIVGDSITQESIDANAGETYISGKLNEDGSVTYKMTKKQHKAMLDQFTATIEEGLQELVDSPDYAFTEITHNSDFTVFDAHLSTEEVGFTESFMVMAFYMYGGIYSIFSGHDAQNIAVNYYSPNGTLISTANSSNMG